MRLKILVAVLAILAAWPAYAAVGDPWVLLTFDWANSRGPMAHSEIFPQFRTKAECQAALRREIQAHAGQSHAEGGGVIGFCSNINGWSK